MNEEPRDNEWTDGWVTWEERKKVLRTMPIDEVVPIARAWGAGYWLGLESLDDR